MPTKTVRCSSITLPCKCGLGPERLSGCGTAVVETAPSSVSGFRAPGGRGLASTFSLAGLVSAGNSDIQGGERKPRLQRGKRRLGATLLEESQRGVEHQQKGDDPGLDIFAERQLDHDGCFEHPWNRRPELIQGHANWMRACVRHRVGAR